MGDVDVPGYLVGDLLGAGGFGEVYRARHELMGREVAIKILHAKYSSAPDTVARFLAEARAIARLSHPGIVDVFDFGQLADGRQFCVMELVHGRTLRALLHDRGRLPLPEALPILHAMAEAIDAAHAAGVAHRDLKPDNVFVIDGGVKLIDFGLAKLTNEDGMRITETGAVFGTPLYMSPEQCRGKAVTVATDAYSFGALAYHVLVGEPPFSGEALELALHHLNDDPEPPSRRARGLDDRVDRVVLALMAKEPDERPRSLVEAISAISGASALPTRRRARIPWRWVTVACAAAGVLAGGLALRGSREAAPADDLGCAAPGDRLAGVWDPAIRSRVAARFAGIDRADVTTSWRLLSAQLDDYATRWSRQWTAACSSHDRSSDRLLYAQRLTCLDKGLVWLRGASLALTDPQLDLASFAEGYTASGLYVLADCDATAVLRAQPPSPTPAQRDQVERLLADFQGAWVKLRAALNAGRMQLVEQGLAGVREAARQLDALGVADAAEPYAVLAEMLTGLSASDPSFTAQAEQAVATAIRRATDLRDDPVLAGAYGTEVALLQIRGAAPTKLDDAMGQWASAIARAGHPLRADANYTATRVGFELARGDDAAARADAGRFAKLVDQLDEPAWTPLIETEMLAQIATAAGDLGEADQLRTHNVDRATALWGPEHRTTIMRRRALYATLVAEHDTARARDDLRAIISADRRTAAAPEELAWAWSETIGRSLELHDISAADEAAAEVERLHVDGSWLADLVENAFVTGSLATASYALDRADGAIEHATPLARARVDAARAYLAFMQGDDATMTAAARRALSTGAGDALVMARALPLVAVADAKAGRKDLALARLPFHTELAAPVPERTREGLTASDRVSDGWVRAALAQWSAAISSYRASLEGLPEHDWNRAEVEAWLGDALVAAGDPTSAIAPLEESLAITATCCDGFHYYAPMAELALARALWATGGDRDRARTLASSARDHFARLGPHRDRDRLAAELWLAAHR